MMTAARIYQIYFSDATRKALDPGFTRSTISPTNGQIGASTGHNGNFFWRDAAAGKIMWLPVARVRSEDGSDGRRGQCVHRRSTSEADVFLFSPFVDYSAFFIKTGSSRASYSTRDLTEARAQAFFNAIAVNVDLKKAVTDTTTTVFCNYFIANGKFWSLWLDIAEKLFAICEREASPLQQELTGRTSHGAEQVQLKVFLMERLASVVLYLHPELRVRAFCPYDLPQSGFARTTGHPREVLLCDALKIAYRHQNYPHYLQMFHYIRNDLFGR